MAPLSRAKFFEMMRLQSASSVWVQVDKMGLDEENEQQVDLFQR